TSRTVVLVSDLPSPAPTATARAMPAPSTPAKTRAAERAKTAFASIASVIAPPGLEAVSGGLSLVVASVKRSLRGNAGDAMDRLAVEGAMRDAAPEAARVRDGVGARLEQLLEDLAAWVAVDTPGGDIAALDGLAVTLAETASRFGLEPELVPTPAGLYL